MKEHLKHSYDIAVSHVQGTQAKQEQNRAAVLNTGDRVLVKDLAFDGKPKLADRWKESSNSQMLRFLFTSLLLFG